MMLNNDESVPAAMAVKPFYTQSLWIVAKHGNIAHKGQCQLRGSTSKKQGAAEDDDRSTFQIRMAHVLVFAPERLV